MTSALVHIPDKTTVTRCVDCARQGIQELLASGLDGKAMNWSLQWGFFDTLGRFDGNGDQAEKADALYERLPEAARAAAPECRSRVHNILLMLRQEGFGTYAIALTIIGALQSLCARSPIDDQLKKQHAAALLKALYQAVKRQDPDAYSRGSLH
jgi:hypothetical protein